VLRDAPTQGTGFVDPGFFAKIQKSIKGVPNGSVPRGGAEVGRRAASINYRLLPWSAWPPRAPELGEMPLGRRSRRRDRRDRACESVAVESERTAQNPDSRRAMVAAVAPARRSSAERTMPCAVRRLRATSPLERAGGIDTFPLRLGSMLRGFVSHCRETTADIPPSVARRLPLPRLRKHVPYS
jgi:hypothetical protein